MSKTDLIFVQCIETCFIYNNGCECLMVKGHSIRGWPSSVTDYIDVCKQR